MKLIFFYSLLSINIILEWRQKNRGGKGFSALNHKSNSQSDLPQPPTVIEHYFLVQLDKDKSKKKLMIDRLL